MHLIPTYIYSYLRISIFLILKSDVFVLVSIHCMLMSNSPTGGNKEYLSISNKICQFQSQEGKILNFIARFNVYMSTLCTKFGPITQHLRSIQQGPVSRTDLRFVLKLQLKL